ncbi:MAG TPA: hypothetical protein VJB57_15590 [Dehalococcoidia bacterium]|nr:hypothetical protein [Dehalococcoidia bacterium]
MISEFEQRLADVLGTRLPPPFTGRVDRPPGQDPADGPVILLGVQRATTLDPDIGSRRPELAPGSNDHRRVLRLSCSVGIEVRPADGEARAQQLLGLDALLYELDAPDMLSGGALVEDGDTGFVIQTMRLVEARAPLLPSAPEAPVFGLTLEADGWFWPVGVVGQAGIEIGEIRVRGVALPLFLLPDNLRLVAGGDAVELTLRVPPLASLRLREDGINPMAFGRLAVGLFDAGGRPGAGTLAGGAAGEGGVRLFDVVNGEATLTYTPPAEAGADVLVVSMEDGENGLGIEVGRFPLVVREG